MLNAQGLNPIQSRHKWSLRLGLEFSNLSLLTRALTHRSYLNEHPEALEDNERLEFLGDAVLDFVVGAWLYNHFPEMEEGELTRLRSALVRTEQLGDFAQEIDLGSAMLLGQGEESNGGRERLSLLCAGFEALVGAVYLENDLDSVEAFIHPFLEKAAGDILTRGRTRDPKSILQEWSQARGMKTPHYRTVMERGPDHAKTFGVEVLINGEVYGHGEGSNKRESAKVAAKEALERLNV